MGGPTDRKFCDEGHPQCKLCWGKCEECDCSPFAICKEHTRKFDTEKEPHKQCPGCSACKRMAQNGINVKANHEECPACHACKTRCEKCDCGKRCKKEANHTDCPTCYSCKTRCEKCDCGKRCKKEANHTDCRDCNACETLCKPCPECENKCGKACNNCESRWDPDAQDGRFGGGGRSPHDDPSYHRRIAEDNVQPFDDQWPLSAFLKERHAARAGEMQCREVSESLKCS